MFSSSNPREQRGTLAARLRGVVKFHSFTKWVKKASKKNVPGTDVDVFICTNDKFREAETTPRYGLYGLLRAVDSMARSLIRKSEATTSTCSCSASITGVWRLSTA